MPTAAWLLPEAVGVGGLLAAVVVGGLLCWPQWWCGVLLRLLLRLRRRSSNPTTAKATSIATPQGPDPAAWVYEAPPDEACPCFLRKNLFISSAGGVVYRRHFAFDCSDASFARDYGTLLHTLTPAQHNDLLAALRAEVTRRRYRFRNSQRRKAEIARLDLRCDRAVYTLDPAAQLRPEFLAVARAAAAHLAEGAEDDLATPHLRHLGHGVYTLPVLTDAFCDALVAELRHFEAIVPDSVDYRVGSMNRHSILLDELGFTPLFLDAFLRDYAQPLAAAVYGLEPLTSHRCFTVHYALDEDLDLASHFDNSEMTLNINLGETFGGGDLEFYGLNKKPKLGRPVHVKHQKGHAMLHLGAMVHQAFPISSGRRVNLVMWFRAAEARRKRGCPMCGGPWPRAAAASSDAGSA